MDNMDSEIAMMFIRNCPDTNLACVFKCKPISKWSLTEVQEAIDEHQREHQTKRLAAPLAKPQALRVATAVADIDPSECNTEYANVNITKVTSPPKSNEQSVPGSDALERVLRMLEKVLECSSHPVPSAPPSPFGHQSPCRVCKQTSHSTRTHCMRERRCLGCLEVGHHKKDCTEPPTVQGGTPAPLFQGN
ncbi:unnamed protein product [Knipowitschia caucasica]